jgi:hypothetical protein
MVFVGRLFTAVYAAISLLFGIAAIALVVLGGMELWHGIDPSAEQDLRERFRSVLEAVGMLTIAVASLELGQTVLEEEVQRDSELSAPTRARRFLSRFLVVVVVALSVETLVAVFELVHTDPSQLPSAAAIGLAAAAILIAWGWFVRLNTSAEALEPGGIAEVQREDKDIDTS